MPPLPPPDRCALLFDLDGTLLDIAPTPESVVVAPELPGTLLALRRLCGDALAVVTGRPVVQVDALLPGVPFAVSGEHGCAIRRTPGGVLERSDLPHLPETWTIAARDLSSAHPGTRVELKAHGFVLHYRAAPEHGPSLGEGLTRLMCGDDRFRLMAAKMAWEVRPATADKGVAVRTLMTQAPFAGRLPVFLGDDVTDEDGIAAAEAMGGLGLRVPDVFGDAVGVRAWLGKLVARWA